MNSNLLIYVSVFGIIVLASNQIGKLVTRLRLPLISGYLLTGILAGPFLLNIVRAEAIQSLHFVEEISLAVIAFAAGSELYLNEIRSQIKRITWNVAAQIVLTFTLGASVFFALESIIPFTRNLGTPEKIGVALLASTILIASSPSSAIALIREMRAKGPFTKTTMGVTVIKDVLIIVLFALNVQIADEIFTGVDSGVLFILLIVLALVGSFVIGYLLFQVLNGLLRIKGMKGIKVAIILVMGYAVFEGADWLRHYTHEMLTFEVVLEPLLICMIASFLLVNYSDHLYQFTALMEEVGPFIYVAFFTLTGDALQLDILVQTWPIALALLGVRLLALFLAGISTGPLTGAPLQHRTLSWMTYITQAGVGLGLAQEVATEFPELGSAFATTMISVIVISQLVGPPLMKFAIRRVGEAHEQGLAQPDAVRDALIFGVDHQSLTLARLLRSHGWQVIMADSDTVRVKTARPADVIGHHIPVIDASNFAAIITASTDAVVAMGSDDDANFTACELAYERGVKRIIVRLNDLSRREQFRPLGAYVIDSSSAIINLIDHLVRSPQVVNRIIREDSGQDMVQISVTDQDVAGVPLRDLRLPVDVLILSINRRGQEIVPHGHSLLLLGDEVTVSGSRESLNEVTLKLGF